MADDFEAQVAQMLFNNSTSSGSCRERLAKKIAELREGMNAPMVESLRMVASKVQSGDDRPDDTFVDLNGEETEQIFAALAQL